MSVLDKLLDAVKLNDDYDEDDYLDDDLLDSDDDDFLDDDQEDKPVKKFFQKFSKKAEEDDYDDFDDERTGRLLLPKQSAVQNHLRTERYLSSRTSLHVLLQRSHL